VARVNIGQACGVAAFLMWGLLPIYWKQLEGVPSLELVAHRVVWSTVILLPVLGWWEGFGRLAAAARRPRLLARQALAAVLVAANWLGFVWAVTHGKMIESSLGYFLTPLASVLLGVAVLGERLRAVQWGAVGLAALGVGWIAAGYHHFPWIALFLAGTFSVYGLVKKTTKLEPLPSLTLETLLLLLPAVVFLTAEHCSGRGHLGRGARVTDLLLFASGPATAAPLLCFAVAARRIPLTTLGLLQYLGPTLQFLCGWLLYHEPFDRARMVGFAIVWGALAIFAADGLRRRLAPTAPAAAVAAD
jgi:chloramphenicol-sensitive protein RarD